MKKRERDVGEQAERRTFGIVQKLLVCILVPLFAVLLVTSIFMGINGGKIVKEIKSSELDAEAQAAAGQVEALFERYRGVSLKAFRPHRSSKTPPPRPLRAG